MSSKRPKGKHINSRGSRHRGNMDKAMVTEGVYGNPRLTHAATSLVGCEIQVQVKNGSIYEGIFRTFSPKMNIVLELAHKVDERSANKTVPSRDLLIDKLVFEMSDIVMMSALDVDLDYASRETFTDMGITNKHNGQVVEKELQPWEAEAGCEVSLEEMSSDSANGWDPNEMFKTNAEKFNVNSSYDPSLEQYTTPLDRKDTKEYKKREMEAAKLASEIEKSDTYKARAALENGDERDEEERFSAVIRGGDQGGKYVPPHMRRPNHQMNRGPRGGMPPQNSRHVPPASHNHHPAMVQAPQVHADSKVNGSSKREAKQCNEHGEPMDVIVEGSADAKSSGSPPNKMERKSSNPKSRDSQIAEFKEFSSQIKLSENNEGNEGHAPQSPQSEGKEGDGEKGSSALLEKSTLNPNAKEFVFNPAAKPFTPKQPSSQIPTPPRPHTQSPVIPPQQIMQGGQQLYPPYYQVPMTMAAPGNQQQQQRFAKRVVVSVQPRAEFNPAAQAAAATGQPLLAQTGMHQQTGQYTIHYVQQQVIGPNGQPMTQVMHVPSTRMMSPQSIQMMQQQHAAVGNEGQVPSPSHNQPGAAQLYMSGPSGNSGGGPIPAHMQPSHPVHMAPHHQPTPPLSQTSHMSNQGAPRQAPSPVHQHPTPPGGHQLQHPPGSGTPQPHIIYQQPSHPPLQPSPHNTPTSPHTMQPPNISFPYSFSSQAPIQGAPQMTFAHAHNMSQSSSHQHGHSPHPQYIMVPQGQAQGHVPQGQFQGYPVQGPSGMGGQSMMPHSGMNIAGGNHMAYAPMYYNMPQMQSQGHPTPVPAAVQPYQHNQ